MIGGLAGPAETVAALVVGFVAVASGVATLYGVGRRRAGPRRQPAPAPGAPSLPADGKVHAWPMLDVRAQPLAGSTRWQVGLRLGDEVETGQRSPLVDRNPPLLGRVALISVFVGCDGRSWTDAEVVAAHRALAWAARWLAGEAVRHGAPVTVGLADTCFRVDDPVSEAVAVQFVPEGDDFGPMEADAAVRGMALASRVAAQLGCRDVADLVARGNARVAAEAHVWFLHLKRRGRSHAIPVGDQMVRGVGIALGYSREASFPEPLRGPARVDPITVAHEVMHLFGATDKYGVDLGNYPTGTVPPSDIMRLADKRLDRLRIGRLTAREVGWPG